MKLKSKVQAKQEATQVAGSIPQTVREAVEKWLPNNKIEAIKEYRKLTGAGLQDAKEAVALVQATQRVKRPAVVEPTRFMLQRSPLNAVLVGKVARDPQLYLSVLSEYLEQGQEVALGVAAILRYHEEKLNNGEYKLLSHMVPGGLAEIMRSVEEDLAYLGGIARGVEEHFAAPEGSGTETAEAAA